MKKISFLIAMCFCTIVLSAQTFQRATSVAAGDTIILVNKANLVAMAGNAGNYRNIAAIKFQEDKIVLTSISIVAQVVLEAVADNGHTSEFRMKTSEGYLYAPNDGKNYLKTQATATGYWAITVNANDTDILVDNAKTDRNVLRYNESSPRFSCYGAKSTTTGSITIYKKVPGSDTPEEVLTTSSIAEVLAMPIGTLCQTQGIVAAEYSSGFILKDNTGAILVYDSSYDKTQAVGDSVTVKAITGRYNNGPQLVSPTITPINTGNTMEHGTATTITAANIANLFALNPVTITYVEAIGTLAVSKTYYNVTIDGETTHKLSISSPIDNIASYANTNVKVSGYFFSTSSDKGTNYINLIMTSIGETTTDLQQSVALTNVTFNGTTIINRSGLSLTVHNLAGAVVAEGNGNIDMSNQPRGIYIVRSGKAAMKIVK